MDRVESYRAQFDEVDRSGRRTTLAVEPREREVDGSTPPHSWYRGEEYELDLDGDDVTVYVRRL